MVKYQLVELRDVGSTPTSRAVGLMPYGSMMRQMGTSTDPMQIILEMLDQKKTTNF